MSTKTKHDVPYLPFFVYGTLIPGQPNAFHWGQEIRSAEAATMDNCRLYDMGYYPMLVEAEEGQVQGMLINLYERRYSEILDQIDLLEGFDPGRPDDSAYKRVARIVTTAEGDPVDAWVYLGDAKYVIETKRITDGNWPEHVAAFTVDLESWWRNISTVSGRNELTE